MKNFKDEVNAVIDAMFDALSDAGEFDDGNESAGRRARVALSKIAGRCVLLRREMMDASKSRQEAKK